MPEQSFEAGIDTLHIMLAWLREQLLQQVAAAKVLQIEMATEEALVNVINYAYGQKGGRVILDANLSKEGWLTLVLKDFGPPFNPLSVEKPDLNLSLEERKIGGLGVLMMRQLMDGIEYQREPGQNVLTLRKKIV